MRNVCGDLDPDLSPGSCRKPGHKAYVLPPKQVPRVQVGNESRVGAWFPQFPINWHGHWFQKHGMKRVCAGGSLGLSYG